MGKAVFEEFKEHIADRLYLEVIRPCDLDRTDNCRITRLLAEKTDESCIELRVDKQYLDDKYGEDIVYKDLTFITYAEDVVHNRKFILKIYWINKAQLDVPTQESGHVDLGYRREKSLPAISSPYIANVLGTFSCDKEIQLSNSYFPREIHYVLYEWAEKVSLNDWCKGKKTDKSMTQWEKADPVYIRQCLQILRECLYGLKDMQGISEASRYFVHRDISPWNIMVFEDEDGCIWIKYIDFGLAVIKQRESEHESERDIGTPGFSRFNISDVSSLARIFYYMISNKGALWDEEKREWKFLSWEETNCREYLKKAENELVELQELEAILKRMWNSDISMKAGEMIRSYEGWLKKQKLEMQAELPDLIGADSTEDDLSKKIRIVIKCNVNGRSKTYHLAMGKGYLLTPNDASLCGEKNPLAYIYMAKTDTDCMVCTVLMNGCRLLRSNKILERFGVWREQERQLQMGDLFIWNKDGQEISWQVVWIEKYGGKC